MTNPPGPGPGREPDPRGCLGAVRQEQDRLDVTVPVCAGPAAADRSAGGVPDRAVIDLRGAQGVLLGSGDQVNYFAVGARTPPEESAAGRVVASLLGEGFQVPPVLTGLVARTRRARWVAVTGPAGSGKSTLLAALARPECTRGVVPVEPGPGQGRCFVHALVFADAATTERSLAEEVHRQLAASVPDFAAAVAAHAKLDPQAWAEAEPLAQLVGGPLARLGHSLDPDRPVELVRVVVDGLDQLRSPYADGVIDHLLNLAREAGLDHLHLIVGVRQDQTTADNRLLDEAEPPPGDDRDGPAAGPTAQDLRAAVAEGARLALSAPPVDALAAYLQARRVDPAAAGVLAHLAACGAGAWLLTRLIADTLDTFPTAEDRDRLVARLRLGTDTDRDQVCSDLYDRVIEQLLTRHVTAAHQGTIPDEQHRRERDTHWRTRLRPVLTGLVAAGAGPITPLSILTPVSDAFDGPGIPDGVRAVLNELEQARLIVRVHPGTEDELVGLFHPTLADHLAQRSGPRRVDVMTGHRVLLDQIEVLASVAGTYTTNPLSRWAADAEPEHLWHLGDTRRVIKSLNRRSLPTPREELARWTRWHVRFTKHPRLGPRHPYTLAARGNIAYVTGQTGRVEEALRLYRELLPDRVAVLGPRHPDTLTTQAEIAAWTGQTGRAGEALRLSWDLLPALVEVLGPRHSATLTIRGNIAAWTGQTGRAGEALRLYRELLPDRVAVLGPRHPDTLTTQAEIAYWTGQTGRAGEALRLSWDLLPDQVEVLGPRHPDTLITRGNIAAWTGRTGRAGEALRLYRELLPDQVAVLGPRHPHTLTAQAVMKRLAGSGAPGAGEPTPGIDPDH